MILLIHICRIVCQAPTDSSGCRCGEGERDEDDGFPRQSRFPGLEISTTYPCEGWPALKEGLNLFDKAAELFPGPATMASFKIRFGEVTQNNEGLVMCMSIWLCIRVILAMVDANRYGQQNARLAPIYVELSSNSP